jgi:hypothetical protein
MLRFRQHQGASREATDRAHYNGEQREAIEHDDRVFRDERGTKKPHHPVSASRFDDQLVV